MPKAEKERGRNEFYAVRIGRVPGVYRSWKECEENVKGFSKSSYEKFRTAAEADAFIKHGSRSSVAEGSLPTSVVAATSPEISTSTTTTKKTYLERKHEKRKTEVAGDVTNDKDWDVVYTDGACSNNGKDGAVAGIGVWYGVNDPRNISERCPGAQTNNRAELIAIIRLLETHLVTPKPLLIKTDSSYSISCIRDWLPKWKSKGWTTGSGTEVKNKEIIVYLSNLLNERGSKGQPVKFQHVRGHQGIIGNEGADKLAVRGSSLPHFERTFVLDVN